MDLARRQRQLGRDVLAHLDTEGLSPLTSFNELVEHHEAKGAMAVLAMMATPDKLAYDPERARLPSILDRLRVGHDVLAQRARRRAS